MIDVLHSQHYITVAQTTDSAWNARRKKLKHYIQPEYVSPKKKNTIFPFFHNVVQRTLQISLTPLNPPNLLPGQHKAEYSFSGALSRLGMLRTGWRNGGPEKHHNNYLENSQRSALDYIASRIGTCVM